MLRADTDWGIFAHCAAAERPSLALRNPIGSPSLLRTVSSRCCLSGADLGGELRGLKPPPSTKTLNSKYHTFLLTLKETVENQPHLQVKLRYLHPFTALHQALQFNTCLVLFSDSSSYVRRPFWFCPVYSIKRPLFLVV